MYEGRRAKLVDKISRVNNIKYTLNSKDHDAYCHLLLPTEKNSVIPFKMSLIPSPPDLKPTIIQMQNVESNDQNQESVDPKFSPSQQQTSQQPVKRKRRRSSSALISQNELDKRRKEHKTAHSIIEKKRRIRMNREFEALKYIIPACRNNLTTSNNNGEGMYKLTILQATVDYIKYLHNVINIQHEELIQNSNSEAVDDDIDFAKIDIDTDGYRNLDNDFDFNKLLEDINNKTSGSNSETENPNVSLRRPKDLSITKLRSRSLGENYQPLPSPLITPELFPSQTPNATPATNYRTINQDFQFKPVTTSSKKSDFQLPKPALPNQSSTSRATESTKLGIINELVSPLNQTTNQEDSASNALLSMKRDNSVASIKSLLN